MRILHVTIKESGIKDVTLHALRHFHASHFISRGVVIQYLSEQNVSAVLMCLLLNKFILIY